MKLGWKSYKNTQNSMTKRVQKHMVADKILRNFPHRKAAASQCTEVMSIHEMLTFLLLPRGYSGSLILIEVKCSAI